MDITIEPIAAAMGKGRDDECEVLGQALSSIPFGCPSKLVVYGHCLVTLPTQLMKL